MARSVSYPRDSIVAFKDGTTFDEFDFESVVEDIQEYAPTLWPSFEKVDKWVGREDHALLENQHAYIGISEYCGLIAIWLLPKDDNDHPQLAQNFVNQIAGKFQKTFGELRKLGSFSNGEGVYERIDGEGEPFSDKYRPQHGYV